MNGIKVDLYHNEKDIGGRTGYKKYEVEDVGEVIFDHGC